MCLMLKMENQDTSLLFGVSRSLLDFYYRHFLLKKLNILKKIKKAFIRFLSLLKYSVAINVLSTWISSVDMINDYN